MNNMLTDNKRNFSLDLLRIFACYLVIQVHAGEFYYIGSDSKVITGINTFWVGILNSGARTAVPLFVMISGYFLLPMHDIIGKFFKKRFIRLLYPFIVWCALYAVYYVFQRGDSIGQMLQHIINIPINYGVEVGHLWYIYMLLGLYILIPIISPWLESCSKKELQGYLLLWLFTTLLPYLHLAFSNGVLGECFWNQSPMLYYFTGFAGYLILGFYIKKFDFKSLIVPIILLIIGYVFTTYLYCSRINTATNVADLELPWQFCSTNVAFMSFGIFMLFKAIRWKGENKFGHLLSNIAARSYGMYLAHIMILNFFYTVYNGLFSTSLIKIPLMAISTFITVYIVIRLMYYLPKAKYWVG